jgi:hypothetical protein
VRRTGARARSRSRHLEEGPRIRAEELLDLRVLGQDLPAARRVRLVRVRAEEVRGHHPFLSLHRCRAHCFLSPSSSPSPREWRSAAAAMGLADGWVRCFRPFPRAARFCVLRISRVKCLSSYRRSGGRGWWEICYLRQGDRGDGGHGRTCPGRRRT